MNVILSMDVYNCGYDAGRERYDVKIFCKYYAD